MNKIQKALTVLVLSSVVVGLTACDIKEASSESSGSYGTFDEFVYHHSKGFSMDCIKQDRGITCDWANKWQTK